MPARPSLAATLALISVACSDAVSPRSQLGELLSAQVPVTATPGAAFDVTGVFGHGSCDKPQVVLARGPSGLRLGLERNPDTSAQVCTAVLIEKTVVVRVDPPFSLPFTVRLARPGAADSVIVVRAP